MNQVAMTENEGEDFNFDSWIAGNNLAEIQNIFVRHKAISLASLRLTSPALQSVMTDKQLLLENVNKIPLIMIAIQGLPNINKVRKVLVQEDEDAVMEQIKDNILALDQTKKGYQDLKQKLPQSVERVRNIKMEQIVKTINKVNKICNDITSGVETRRKLLVQKLESIKNDAAKEQKNIEDDVKEDDVKEYDVLSASMKQLNAEMEHQTIKLAQCNDLIETVKVYDKESKRKRKEEIKQIGQATNDKFIKTKNTLDKNTKTVQNMIDDNNKYTVNIDVLINEKRLKRILNKINNLGKIVNDEKEQVFPDEDADDVKVNQIISELSNKILKGYPNHNYSTQQYKQYRNTLVKVIAPILVPKHCIPYTPSVNQGNANTFAALINMDCDDIAYTNLTTKNWIQATFNQQVNINTMQIASSGAGGDWGVAYLNGHGRQLQYKNTDGNWINIMPMKNFKLFEIQNIKFDATVTTNAIRVYTETNCYTAIGCWRFF